MTQLFNKDEVGFFATQADGSRLDVKAADICGYTHCYCYSNRELFCLPSNMTPDLETARCMFNTYFNLVGRTMDANTLVCQSTYVACPLTFINNPICLRNNTPGAEVEVFLDINFSGASKKYPVSHSVSCMDTTKRNTSFWGGFGFGAGEAVRNDEISSLRVPAGVKITCYEHCNFQGKVRVFTEDCANVGAEWNDIISSFVIEPNLPSTQIVKQLV